jgi:hypothetical protein
MCHLWIKLVVNPVINMHIFTCDSILFIIPSKWKFNILKNRFDTIFVPSSFTNSCYKTFMTSYKVRKWGKIHLPEAYVKGEISRDQQGGQVKEKASFIHSFIHPYMSCGWKRIQNPTFIVQWVIHSFIHTYMSCGWKRIQNPTFIVHWVIHSFIHICHVDEKGFKTLLSLFNGSFIHSFIHICHVDEKGFKTLLSLFIESFIHSSIYVMWMKKDSKPYFHCSLGGWGWPIHWGVVRVTTELFKCGNLFFFVCFGYLQNWNHSLTLV